MSKKIKPSQTSLFTVNGSIIQHKNAAIFVREAIKHYGKEIIENRSLPRLEDGLKPIQRLLLWSGYEIAKTNFMKSAELATYCIGKYSPHGDNAAYKSLCSMVKEKFPYMAGRGNFGSATQEPAAGRYTEARVHPIGRKLMVELEDMGVVPYEPNYNDKRVQPCYFPSLLPNILLNNTSGIAMAIVTKFPAFNVLEVAQAIQVYLSTGNIKNAIKKIQGPDVGKCRILSTKEEVNALIETGDGTLEFECPFHVEQHKNYSSIIVTGYCPEFSVAGFWKKCEKLLDAGIIDAVRDETSMKNGDRIDIEYSNPDAYNQIVKLLRKKISYKFNVLQDIDGNLIPKMMSVAKIIEEWTTIRRKTVEATIKKSIADQENVITREKARFKAISDKKALFRAIESELPFEDALHKELGLNAEDAAIVAKMPLESLRKANVDKVAENIKKMEAALEDKKQQLNHIDDVIKEQIQDFIKWLKAEYPQFVERQTVVS